MTEPTIEVERTEPQGMGPLKGGRRKGVRFWFWRLFRIAIVLALIPVVLTVLYLPAVVHPIST
ncbi:MAG: monofunctional biosynthetic peptidoglycan transglycosylase, partial [Rhizobiaceae bacterium]|nr:monofunctional biosynthetic peptidoglycan transglycosylase [Rhizobiaceae bacterium]